MKAYEIAGRGTVRYYTSVRLIKSETRRGLRIATLEGSAAAVHNVLVGSAVLTGFVLAWGANDFQLGLLGAMPFLGSLFQVVGAYVADTLSAVHWRFGGLEVANYQLLFVASILLRLPALFLLKCIHQEGRN